MKIFTSIDEFAATGKQKNVVTTGTFDGVHLGHRAILDRVCSIAQAKNTESVLLTFHPHPRQILYPHAAGMFFLTSLAEREELLEKAGIQNLIIHPFSRELSQVSAMDYVQEILMDKLKTETLVIGHDHRFGRDRSGSIKDLKIWGKEFGFKVEEIAPVSANSPETISSTKIRKALNDGDMTTANNYLGYQFFIHAKVIKGMQIGGNELGYPTANLQIDFKDKIIPSDGIYAVYINIEGIRDKEQGERKGMMSIGLNPTIENKGRTMEVHIFDFNEDIYGKTVKVSFFKKIRNEEKFNNMAELKAQLDKDKGVCLGIL